VFLSCRPLLLCRRRPDRWVATSLRILPCSFWCRCALIALFREANLSKMCLNDSSLDRRIYSLGWFIQEFNLFICNASLLRRSQVASSSLATKKALAPLPRGNRNSVKAMQSLSARSWIAYVCVLVNWGTYIGTQQLKLRDCDSIHSIPNSTMTMHSL